MSTVSFNKKLLEEAAEFAVAGGAYFMQNEIVKITPRDPARMPKDPKRRVSGHLKQSIGTQQVKKAYYKVGVRKGYFDTEEYARAQEFGSIRVPPRSFIRKAMYEQGKKLKEVMQSLFNQYLSKKG